jgi:uncharacterized protein YegP (UPF0339 family)
MATAKKQARATTRHFGRSATAASQSAAIEFVVIEDNSGDYHWTILDSGGESVAQSKRFASYDDAEQAARVVRDGAGWARFERRAATDRPVDLVARREATAARDDSDAERWLDEGGSFGSEAVAKWPAGR